jgi:hypothetical protein
VLLLLTWQHSSLLISAGHIRDYFGVSSQHQAQFSVLHFVGLHFISSASMKFLQRLLCFKMFTSQRLRIWKVQGSNPATDFPD